MKFSYWKVIENNFIENINNLNLIVLKNNTETVTNHFLQNTDLRLNPPIQLFCLISLWWDHSPPAGYGWDTPQALLPSFICLQLFISNLSPQSEFFFLFNFLQNLRSSVRIFRQILFSCPIVFRSKYNGCPNGKLRRYTI